MADDVWKAPPGKGIIYLEGEGVWRADERPTVVFVDPQRLAEPQRERATKKGIRIEPGQFLPFLFGLYIGVPLGVITYVFLGWVWAVALGEAPALRPLTTSTPATVQRLVL